MAFSKENVSHAESRVSRALISMVTENGFTIVRSCDVEGGPPVMPGKHCFVVEDPYGQEHDVTVEFSRAAIEAVQGRRPRMRLISPQSVFWVNCAERWLATYLWEHETADGWQADPR